MSAAPVTPARSVDNLSLPSTANSEWYSVGGPGSIVMRSRSMRSTTASASKTATGSIVAPRKKEVISPAFSPKVWKYGLIIK